MVFGWTFLIGKSQQEGATLFTSNQTTGDKFLCVGTSFATFLSVFHFCVAPVLKRKLIATVIDTDNFIKTLVILPRAGWAVFTAGAVCISVGMVLNA